MIEYESLAKSNAAYVDELEAAAARVIRGGGWFTGPKTLQSAFRNHDNPVNSLGGAGLRIARTL